MTNRVQIPGSERHLRAEATAVDSPDPNEQVEVTIVLRRRAPLPPAGSHILGREEFAALYGADPADVALVEQFAGENDLTVTEVDLGRRSVVLSGTLANMTQALGTNLNDLRIFQFPGGRFRGRTGSLSVPAHLDGVITGVFGLDNRPQAGLHLRRRAPHHGRAAGDASYTPDAVAKFYDFPSDATGAGQTVALIELGGGYRVFDVDTYFKNLGLNPAPVVTAVSVDGAVNKATGDPAGPDGEVVLDIEVVGAAAPGARIAVYFAPNTDQGFLDAVTTAIHDNVRKPSVVSISWGGPESTWTSQALQSFDQAFQDATLLGVTICVAAGDDGSSDGVTDGKAHVDFPASSPNVLACGGTRLVAKGSTIQSETVWNESGLGATGGGVSEFFPLPSYQVVARVPPSVSTGYIGRGVPDIAGDADPATGYELIVDGRSVVYGGTSAVAPLWSALVARLNQRLGKPLGFLNPKLYQIAGVQPFHDITSGNNGAYAARAGWDPCTGLGTPDGAQLLAALTPKAASAT